MSRGRGNTGPAGVDPLWAPPSPRTGRAPATAPAAGPVGGPLPQPPAPAGGLSVPPSAGLPPVVPPLRFTCVEDGVYRGGYPVLNNFRFLRRLRLRTVVSLVPEEPTSDLREFCSGEGITLRHLQCERFKDNPPLLMPDVSSILECLINKDKHPVFIHCLDGGSVTGQVIIALRRLQGWDHQSAMAEHRRWTRDRAVTPEEERYSRELEEVACPITLPQRLPRWLWDGALLDRDSQPRKHRFFRLRHPAAPAAEAGAAAPAAGGENSPKTGPARESRQSGSALFSLAEYVAALPCPPAPPAPAGPPAPVPRGLSVWPQRAAALARIDPGRSTGEMLSHEGGAAVVGAAQLTALPLELTPSLRELWLDPGPCARFTRARAEPRRSGLLAAGSFADLIVGDD